MLKYLVMTCLLISTLLGATDRYVDQQTVWAPLDRGYSYISLDPFHILESEPHHWRREDFELYGWSALPGVLVFDTRDYSIQANFFKRLAFFVEKSDWQGQISSWDSLYDHHSYNAHNYRAADLARFFNQSAHGDLTSGEKLLKEILVQNGIIGGGARRYYPISGGVLSISQESYPGLRKRLLVHELLHGVFYILTEYRQTAFDVWEELSVEEKSIWYLFLYSRDYHGDDTYLAVNEFQAYLLQQPEENWFKYFEEVIVPGIRSHVPMEWVYLGPYLSTIERPFESARRTLETALQKVSIRQRAFDMTEFLDTMNGLSSGG